MTTQIDQGASAEATKGVQTMKIIAIVAALLAAAISFGQGRPPWQQPQGLLGAICAGNEQVDAETAGIGFCGQSLEVQRRLLNRLAVLNREGHDRVWFDFRNRPDVFYEIGPNPAGWKVSVDELDVGIAVSYMKRADNRPDDPVVGVERARLTMAVFKTSSPVLHTLRSEANEGRRWWEGEIPIQYTWDHCCPINSTRT